MKTILCGLIALAFFLPQASAQTPARSTNLPLEMSGAGVIPLATPVAQCDRTGPHQLTECDRALISCSKVIDVWKEGQRAECERRAARRGKKARADCLEEMGWAGRKLIMRCMAARRKCLRSC
jgi:hypothetical protein